jgi:hypothetical protein
MISQAFTVGTTAIKLVATSVNARQISIHPSGNGTVYLGGSTVTAASGMLTEKGAVPYTFTLPANNELWAIVASGTVDVRVMIPANMSGV